MKKVLLIALTFTSIQGVAQAQMGNRIHHELNCEAPQLKGHLLLGMSYQLNCETQAVAPEYSIKDCSLTSRAVSPNATPNLMAIHQQTQDAEKAVFIGRGVSVQVNKSKMTAKITLENGAISICSAQK